MDQQQLIEGIKANAQEEFKASITAHEVAKREMQARLDGALADLASASKAADEAKSKFVVIVVERSIIILAIGWIESSSILIKLRPL